MSQSPISWTCCVFAVRCTLYTVQGYSYAVAGGLVYTVAKEDCFDTNVLLYCFTVMTPKLVVVASPEQVKVMEGASLNSTYGRAHCSHLKFGGTLSTTSQSLNRGEQGRGTDSMAILLKHLLLIAYTLVSEFFS